MTFWQWSEADITMYIYRILQITSLLERPFRGWQHVSLYGMVLFVPQAASHEESYQLWEEEFLCQYVRRPFAKLYI